MHIPDGYLSPATCATFYAASLPFWTVAMRKMRASLLTRRIPLLSLFAAFSFVVMMFNLPLPGGTTGHAVGVAIAAIVLGPWASIIAISVALGVQAIFFGDGGITALGANCFNMAVAGSFVAHGVYRLVAGQSEIHARRRVLAAGLAGYAAINVAALLTAFEFGIQPMLFTAVDGTPLYAPYPLQIAVPAMMLGHVTFAGLAEMISAAAIVAYLQRAEPSLLSPLIRPSATFSPQAGRRATNDESALDCPSPRASGERGAEGRVRGRSLRPLWAALGALMIATPLGLLAAGAAWGEWSAEDFANVDARQEIRAASLNVAPPEGVPAGLQRLSSVWTAPMPDYAPSFIRSEAMGYILSALFGVGLVIVAVVLLQRLTGWRDGLQHSDPA